MTTAELIKVDHAAVQTIDEIVDECGLIRSAQEQGVMAGIRMASGIGKLRSMLNEEMMNEVMALQGSSLGFVTDKDRDRNKDGSFGYPVEIVKDCFIEALLRGARPIGNEFNIIASRCYLTKNYFQRTLANFPGLTDLVIEFGVPADARGNSLVPVKAVWKFNGKPMSINCDIVSDDEGRVIADNRIPVRVNNGMIVDAVLGKADRKIRARIMERLTNTTFSDGDAADVIDVVMAEPAGGSLKERMRSTAPSSSEANRPQQRKQQPVSLCPLPNEDVKDYYARIKKLIETASSHEELGAIASEVDGALDSGFMNAMRHKDLSGRIQVRAAEVVSE